MRGSKKHEVYPGYRAEEAQSRLSRLGFRRLEILDCPTLRPKREPKRRSPSSALTEKSKQKGQGGIEMEGIECPYCGAFNYERGLRQRQGYCWECNRYIDHPYMETLGISPS